MPGLAEALGPDERTGSGPTDKAGAVVRHFMARGERLRSGAASYEQSVLGAMAGDCPPLQQLPVAQCTYLTDFSETAPVHCVRADPVHIRTSLEHAQLDHSASLAINAEESAELLEVLNQHFAGDGFTFLSGHRDRWYLSGLPGDGLVTAPTSVVAGRHLAPWLAGLQSSGRDSAPATWNRLSTEIQMLLHEQPVNRRRLAQGKLPVNALWFYGGGRVTSSAGLTKIGAVFCDTAFTVGLGQLLGRRIFTRQEGYSLLQSLQRGGMLEARPMLVVETGLLDALMGAAAAQPEAQIGTILSALDTLFEKLSWALRHRRVSSVVLDTCDHSHYRQTPWSAWRIWRKWKSADAGAEPLIFGGAGD